MFVPALLAVFVLSPDPADPTTASLESASFDVLGPNTTLRVEAVTAPLADAAALDRAGAADGVVELNWDSADALGGWLQIAHLSSDDVQRVHHHRWLFGGDAVATLGYRFSSVATSYAGLGIEAVLGRTFVYTHGVEVATGRNLRGVAEIGFRTSF